MWDERFSMHRHKSTSCAAGFFVGIGTILLGISIVFNLSGIREMRRARAKCEGPK